MNLFSLEIVYLFPEITIGGNFNGNRSLPSNFMWDIEYSVITSDVIKSFDYIYIYIYIYIYAMMLTHSYVESPIDVASLSRPIARQLHTFISN